MFKLKAHKNGKHSIRDSFNYGADMLAGRISGGLKFTEDRMEDLRKYIQKHHDLYKIAGDLGKHSSKITAVLGAGLIIYSVYKMLKK